MNNDTPKTEEKQQLPEAPASATVKVKSPAGFEYLFTMRDEKASNLLFKMTAMEKKFTELQYTPVAQGFKTEKAKKECPVHKVMMSEKISKKTGKAYFSHWEFPNNYPNLGGQCFGQEYTSLNQQVNIPSRDVNDF